MKNIFKSKTMIVSMVLLILPQLFNWLTPEQFQEWGVGNAHVLSLIGVVMGWLRTVTTTALKDK